MHQAGHARGRFRSALLNEVALVGANGRVVRWAHRLASGGSHGGVALADHVRVLVVSLAAVAEEDSRLDASAAHLHFRLRRVLDVRWREGLAHSQRSLSSTVAQDWRAFHVDLLVDVQPVALELDVRANNEVGKGGSHRGTQSKLHYAVKRTETQKTKRLLFHLIALEPK